MNSKLLVIDDERPTLNMLKLFLDVYGYEVFTAENGTQALALFEEHRMPIVLTDIKMPGMDGLEVLKRIKQLAPITEVIIMTGHGDMDMAIEALGLDATDFINKPISQSNLDSALKRAQERIRIARSEGENYPVRFEGEYSIIEINGSINSASEASLKEAFDVATDGKQKLILAFSHSSAVNGAGIALMTQSLLGCRDRGVAVWLAGLGGNVASVLDMVGVTKLASIAESVESVVNES